MRHEAGAHPIADGTALADDRKIIEIMNLENRKKKSPNLCVLAIALYMKVS